MARIVKRAYKYRFYPTPEQAEELARTFVCVRLVYNKALEERARAYTQDGRKVTYVQSSAALTAWKKTPELAFLNEVSSVPLQQALRHLQAAFGNFLVVRPLGRAGERPLGLRQPAPVTGQGPAQGREGVRPDRRPATRPPAQADHSARP
jgi:transposase